MNLDDRLRDYLGGAGDGLDVTAAGAEVAHQRARTRAKRQRRSANVAVALMVIGASMIYLSQRQSSGDVSNAIAAPQNIPFNAVPLDLDFGMDFDVASLNETAEAPVARPDSPDSSTSPSNRGDTDRTPPWADLILQPEHDQPPALPRLPQPTPDPPIADIEPTADPPPTQGSNLTPPATAAADDTGTAVIVDLRLPALNLQVGAATETGLGTPSAGAEWRTDIRQFAKGPDNILAVGSATLVRSEDGTPLSDDAVLPMVWLINPDGLVTMLDHEGIGTAIFRTLVVEATETGWRAVVVNGVDLASGSRPTEITDEVSIYESPDGRTWSRTTSAAEN